MTSKDDGDLNGCNGKHLASKYGSCDDDDDDDDNNDSGNGNLTDRNS